MQGDTFHVGSVGYGANSAPNPPCRLVAENANGPSGFSPAARDQRSPRPRCMVDFGPANPCGGGGGHRADGCIAKGATRGCDPEIKLVRAENAEIKATLHLTNKRLEDLNAHLADQTRRIDETNQRMGAVHAGALARIDATNHWIDAGSFRKGTAPPYRRRWQWGWATRTNDSYLCSTEVPVAAGVAAMSHPLLRACPVKGPRTEAGAALLVFLLVLVTAASHTLLSNLNAAATIGYRDKQTARALMDAKAALIGYAASANTVPAPIGTLPVASTCGKLPPYDRCPRPGDLPCPDRNNDGRADFDSSGDYACSGSGARLGRLPWRTLGLPDLRDDSGERLWYAVSQNFVNDRRTRCSTSTASTCLHSDSRGTITVRDANVTAPPYDGASTDPYVKAGAVAVIIAPGPILRRGLTDQNRSCTPGGCGYDGNADGDVSDAEDDPDVCVSLPPTATAKCRPLNFLDRDPVTGEDNNFFADSATTPTAGFIQGTVVRSGRVVVNDRISVITYGNIMPLLERRVAGEILACLEAYADSPAHPENNGRYPWAALLHDPPLPPPPPSPNYDDDTGVRFGRLPDVLDDTGDLANAAMSSAWPTFPATPSCRLPTSPSIPSWWMNWKERVFYALADAYKPDASTNPPDVPSCGGTTSCLNVNGPSVTTDRQVVVTVAGKRLKDLPGVPADQIRGSPTQKADVRNYLEQGFGPPPVLVPPSETLVTRPVSAEYNDVVVYLPR